MEAYGSRFDVAAPSDGGLAPRGARPGRGLLYDAGRRTIGPDDDSRIYKTTDAGLSWTLRPVPEPLLTIHMSKVYI
jgi:hypothetical protein